MKRNPSKSNSPRHSLSPSWSFIPSCLPVSVVSPRRRNIRAFFVMDIVLGLSLATGLLIMITVSIIKADHAQRQLAAARTSARIAEDALLSLQAGQPLPPGKNISLEKLPADPALSLPANTAWVQLTLPATAATPAATLIGLVPNADHLPLSSGGSAK